MIGNPRVGYYDGVSAVQRFPALIADGDGFSLVDGDRRDGPFAFAALEPREPIGGAPVFGLKKRPGWRITFVDGLPDWVADRLPRARRYGGIIDRIGLWPATLAFAVVAAVTIVMVVQLPTVVAPLIPTSVERKMGDLMIGDLGGRVCNGPGGQAALNAIASRLGAPDYVDVRVVKIPVVNAVTLPGGKILIFDKLLQEAQSPDEVAGVLAHELGHARHRDVMAGLLRQFGLSLVLGGMQDNVGSYTNAVLATTYTRSAETSADGYAIDDLRNAHISPTATADFFHRLGRDEPKLGKAGVVISYLSTHPMSADRANRFSSSATKGAAYTPALDPAQWQALRGICANDPKAKGLELDF
jgi:Zn-dependent protease with chaperone function